MHPRRAALWSLLAAVVLVAAVPSATAKERSDTESIAAGEYAPIQIEFPTVPRCRSATTCR